LATGRPADRVGSSNRFDAARRLDRWRDNVSVFLVVAVTTVALLALVATFLVSAFCAAVLATLFLHSTGRYVRRRRDAGPADQRSKRLA
jgi:predicted PurR-regulated permease PerM